MEKPAYDIALREDQHGNLDDVVVRDVETFRMERLDDQTFWISCSLLNGERITWVLGRGKEGEEILQVETTEYPQALCYETGSLTPAA
jgi:hypothetical protein